MKEFVLVLGNENEILPGKLWTEYSVDVQEDKMVCVQKKNPASVIEISYSSFNSAEFGIGSGNLWLQCVIDGKRLNFCSPKKSWKSDAAKLLIEKINEVTEIKDMKEYKAYTGPFSFFAMFK